MQAGTTIRFTVHVAYFGTNTAALELVDAASTDNLPINFPAGTTLVPVSTAKQTLPRGVCVLAWSCARGTAPILDCFGFGDKL